MEPLDQDAVNLTKAIRTVETKGQKDPYTARGGSQEYGAYQFTPDTWATASQKYLGRTVPLEQATKEDQNQVAYKSIKAFKDQGYNVGQIASLWNAGKPDAYLDPNHKGVNKFGVQYDTPGYAKAVATAYQSMKGTTPTGATPTVQPNAAPQAAPQAAAPTPTPEAPQSTTDKVLNSGVAKGIQRFFPGAQTGKAIGTLGGLLIAKAKDAVKGTHEADYYDTSAPTPRQVVADVAQGALTVASGLPEAGVASPLAKTLLGGAKGFAPAASAIGRIGQGALLGGSLTGLGAIASGDKNVGKEALIGAATGGVLGAASEVLTKAASSLPKRFLRSNVGKINDETAEYAVQKGLKNPEKMLQESQQSIVDLDNQLTEVLKAKGKTYVQPTGETIVGDVLGKFPQSELTQDEIVETMKKMVPLKKKLITKMMANDITLNELHELNSAIGKATFKTVFDDPAVRAGKQVGNEIYHTISNVLKTELPESAPLFDNLSKEIQLRKALDVAINSMGKHKAFNLRDLMAIIAGGAAAGPLGAAAGFLGEKFVTSPTANMVTGGLIKKAGDAALGAAKPLLLRNVTGGTPQ